MSRLLTILVLLAVCGFALSACGDKGKDAKDGKTASGKVEIAFIVNGSARFWDIAHAGMLAASRDFNIKCEIFIPEEGQSSQKRFLEDLLTRGIKGVAISPIDPANQGPLLDQVAAKTHLVTHDSDAPNSKRKYYVGVNNYLAGREAGKLVKEAMPDGGSVMIFVGRMEQLNAQQRRQGVIDELLDRPVQDNDNLKTIDPPSGEIKNDKYNVLGTMVDEFKSDKKIQQPQDALAKHPDLGCMVGLFEYNPPAIYQAVKAANRLGKTKIVGFDEADETLAGIAEGHIQGTIAQQPFEYGYQSVKILAGLIRDDKKLLPDKAIVHLPPIIVKKEGPDKPALLGTGPNLTVNAKSFREDVNAKLKSRDAAK
jgi:ribose transport system substrate-binding protein